MFYSEPKILGISMASGRNRRRLVVATYAFLTIVVAALVWKPWGSVLQGPVYFLVIIFSGVSNGTFGAIVRQFTFPVRRNVIDPGLELEGHNPTVDLDPEPDERDTKIRDHAYFIAFRVIAAGLIMSFLILVIVARPDFPAHSLFTVARCIDGLLMPLAILALTLPQAIILWQQPDLITD